MTDEMMVLAATAATVGLVHTVLGPDHYLPFIVLARARSWSGRRTALITLLCGLGHVLSSVILGFAGIALGTALFQLEAIEAFRGEIAAWLLIAFGFTYGVWGLHRALRRRRHEHVHVHEDGEVHWHPHQHQDEHTHPHPSGASLTPWVLFTIFVFGPCEPLIPLVMYPAAEHNMGNVAVVAAVFSVATIGTMMAVVLASSYSMKKLPLGGMDRYSHALAGLAILVSGGAIKLFGL